MSGKAKVCIETKKYCDKTDVKRLVRFVNYLDIPPQEVAEAGVHPVVRSGLQRRSPVQHFMLQTHMLEQLLLLRSIPVN